MVFNGVTENLAYLSSEYENLIRIIGNDIPGEKKTLIGLTQIRGLGYMFANSMLQILKINPDSSEKNIFQGVIKELEFLGSHFRGLVEVDFKSQKTNLRCQFSSEYILQNNIEKNNSINISLQPEALKVIKK